MEQTLNTIIVQIQETHQRVEMLEGQLKNPQLPLSLKVSISKQRVIALEKLNALRVKIKNECEGYISIVEYSFEGKIYSKTFIGDENKTRAYLKIMGDVFKVPLHIIKVNTVHTSKLLRAVSND